MSDTKKIIEQRHSLCRSCGEPTDKSRFALWCEACIRQGQTSLRHLEQHQISFDN